MKKAWVIISRIDAKDGQAPEWILIFAEGESEIEQEGKCLMDRTAYDQVAKYFERRGNDLVIDYEHQTIAGAKAPAAGWIKELRYDDGVGIMARVDWTQEAADYIVKKEYRYFSPVFMVRKSDKRVVAVHSVALTNAPKINHLTPLLAKLGANLEKEETSMELLKKLIAKLGLAGDADEDKVIEAIDALQKKKPEEKEVIAKEVLTALDLAEGDASVVVASIHALKQAGKGAVSREEFAKLQNELKERDAKEIVAKAMADGKVTPDQKDWALDYAKRDLSGFKTFVAKAPVVIPIDQLPGKKTESDKAVLDEATLKIAKTMGNSEEDIKKYGT